MFASKKAINFSYVETVKPPPLFSMRSKNLPSLTTIVARRALEMPRAKQYALALETRFSERLLVMDYNCGKLTALSTVYLPHDQTINMRDNTRMKKDSPIALAMWERIEARLKHLGISAHKASENIGHKDALRNIERGSVPIASRLIQIAKELKCSVDYLLGETDDPSPSEASSAQINIKLLEIFLRKALIQNGQPEDVAEQISQAVARYYPILEPVSSTADSPQKIEKAVDRLLNETAPGLKRPALKK